ncbi:heavy metal-associated domain-containing protein [Nibrella saemangeumensis]
MTLSYRQALKGEEKTTSQQSLQGTAKTVIIPVKGMSCSACQANVKQNVASLQGVQDVTVSLEKREAKVTYTQGKVSPEQLVKTINELGYQAGKPVEAKK